MFRLSDGSYGAWEPVSTQVYHHERFPQYVYFRGLWWHESALEPTFDSASGKFTGYAHDPKFNDDWIMKVKQSVADLEKKKLHSMPHPDDDERTHRYVRSQAPWRKPTPARFYRDEYWKQRMEFMADIQYNVRGRFHGIRDPWKKEDVQKVPLLNTALDVHDTLHIGNEGMDRHGRMLKRCYVVRKATSRLVKDQTTVGWPCQCFPNIAMPIGMLYLMAVALHSGHQLNPLSAELLSRLPIISI